MDIGEFPDFGTIVPFHHGGFTGGVVEEMQDVASVGQVGDLLAMEGVVRGAGGSSDLLHPEAAGVVFKDNGFGSLTHGLQLAALFPGVQPFPVAGGVADFVVRKIYHRK